MIRSSVSVRCFTYSCCYAAICHFQSTNVILMFQGRTQFVGRVCSLMEVVKILQTIINWQILVNNFFSDYINIVHAPFLLMIIHITFSSRKLSKEEGLLLDVKEEP